MATRLRLGAGGDSSSTWAPRLSSGCTNVYVGAYCAYNASNRRQLCFRGGAPMLESHFIDDKPLIDEEDSKFAVHSRVANCIVNDIVGGKDTEDKRIALIGEWGSGKSTVMSFVQKKFDALNSLGSDKSVNPRKYRFLTFDLWTHSGEMLQRSFLQSLYALINEDVIAASDSSKGSVSSCVSGDVKRKKADERKRIKRANERWSKLKNQIDGVHVDETVVQTRTVPFFAGVAATASVILLLSQLVLGAYYETLSEEMRNAFSQSTAVLFVTVFLTAIVTVGLFLYRVWQRRKSKGVSYWAELRGELSDIFAGRSTEITVCVRDSDVIGSIVFQKYLTELLECAGLLVGPLCIVIALDNLDRLRSDQIRSSWDVIELFADALSRPNCSLDRKRDEDALDSRSENVPEVWLLLPVSERALRCMVEEARSGAIASGDPNNVVGVAGGNASAALTKLFMRRYEITHPLRSEWRGLVCDCVTKAFPDIRKYPDTIQFIFSAFDTIQNERMLRSSRSVISIVNDMVAYYRMYGNVECDGRIAQNGSDRVKNAVKVDLRSVALFAVIKYRNSAEDHGRAISLEDLVAAYCGHRQQAEWLEFPQFIIDYENQYLPIVMMTYGVSDPAIAQEVFLEGRLRGVDFIRDMDLDAYSAAMPSLWNILLDCVSGKSSVLSINPESDQFFALLDRVLDSESDDAGKVQLIWEMADMAPRSGWSLRQGGGATMAKLVDWGMDDVGLSMALLKTLEDSSGRVAQSSGFASQEMAYQIWRDNALAFCRILDDTGTSVEVASVRLRLGGATYRFWKDVFQSDCCEFIFEAMSVDGETAAQDVVRGLVKDASKRTWADDRGFLKFIGYMGKMPLFSEPENNGIVNGALRNGLGSEDDHARFFCIAWVMWHLSCSNEAKAYCKSFDGDGYALFRNASLPYELAAVIAACLDEELGLSERLVAFGDDLAQDEERRSDEAVLLLVEISTADEIRRYLKSAIGCSKGVANSELKRKVATIILDHASECGLSDDEAAWYRDAIPIGAAVAD